MLRPPSRFTDSSAPAETLPAASGRCRRRIRASDVAQAPESCGHAGSRLFLRIGHNVRCAETFLHRFHSLFVMPFRTAFPSFPIYMSVRPIAEWQERDAVLFHFGRFGSHCRSSFRLLSDIEFPFASLLSLSAASPRNELKRGFVPIRFGSGGSHRRRFLILFVAPFRTAFPPFPIHLSIRPITEWRERDAVLFHFGSNGPHRRRFRLLFIASFSTVFPSSSPYTTPAITGGEPGRETVLSSFRKYDSRFRGSHCNSGKCAALAGFREGGRKGKPVPPLSLFSGYTSSGRKGRDEKRYIQFKSRPSDRRHAYF